MLIINEISTKCVHSDVKYFSVPFHVVFQRTLLGMFEYQQKKKSTCDCFQTFIKSQRQYSSAYHTLNSSEKVIFKIE